MSIPESIQALIECGWSQKDIASYMGITATSVSLYKSQKCEPVYSTGAKIVSLAQFEQQEAEQRRYRREASIDHINITE